MAPNLETTLLETFRSLPEDAQPRAVRLLQTLTSYLVQQRCGGMGVEGFPCGEPDRPCEECHQIWNLLEQLESGKTQPMLSRVHPLTANITE